MFHPIQLRGAVTSKKVAMLITRNVLPIGLFVVSLAMLIYHYPSQKGFLSLSSEGLKL